MNTTITGTIHTIFPTERYRDFFKRVFWIKETNVKYPNIWALEMWHEDGAVLDQFRNHSGEVSCEVSVKGKMWSKNGKDNVINILHCTGIKKI